MSPSQVTICFTVHVYRLTVRLQTGWAGCRDTGRVQTPGRIYFPGPQSVGCCLPFCHSVCGPRVCSRYNLIRSDSRALPVPGVSDVIRRSVCDHRTLTMSTTTRIYPMLVDSNRMKHECFWLKRSKGTCAVIRREGMYYCMYKHLYCTVLYYCIVHM